MNKVFIGGIGSTGDKYKERLHEQDGRKYLAIPFREKGNDWVVMFSWGKSFKGVPKSYITVRKVTNNPFGMLGTQFENVNEAIKKYKSPTMISNLAQAEARAMKYGYR